MITSIHYKNFKALQDATLPLGRFTLIVGANGTGKSTALKAAKYASNPSPSQLNDILSVGLSIANSRADVLFTWDNPEISIRSSWWQNDGRNVIERFQYLNSHGNPQLPHEFLPRGIPTKIEEFISNFEIFSFEAGLIANEVSLAPNIELKTSGLDFAGVLDRLRDNEPERFIGLNRELNEWFPEFDQILFGTPNTGSRSFLLRTTVGKHKIKASELSDGTLLALAYLTIAYLPNPPKIVAFEEPEKGIHPRLLRNIQEAMYRLAFPENYGEKREPIQVIATTHSPYLLDLYKDNPEEIVISSKDEKGVHFERLIDKPHIKEILQDAPLGEIWYSGVLGGVPAQV